MFKVFLMFIAFVLVCGCSSIPEAIEFTQEQIELREADKARKAEEARIAKEAAARAEADSKAKEEERKRLEAEARKAPPHPPERRTATQAAGDAYHRRGEQPPILIVQNPEWGRTLWKPDNHSLNGVVMLLDTKFRPDYDSGNIASVVVSADPYGSEVIAGSDARRTVSGVGKVCPPYSDGRVCIRWDGLSGRCWRPGPVFVVLKTKDGRRTTWMLADPAIRTER